jgi:hypothetical protein
MGGEHIALLQLLRLHNLLKSTVMSREFMDLKVFKGASDIIMSDEFWKYIFLMCCALYAPMCVLCLADQNKPAMDKLYSYKLQTDCMLPKWLGEVEKSTSFLTPNMIATMGQVQSAGVSDSESEDDDTEDNNDEQSYSLGEEDDEVDSDNEVNGDIVERQVVLRLDIHLLKCILLTAKNCCITVFGQDVLSRIRLCGFR